MVEKTNEREKVSSQYNALLLSSLKVYTNILFTYIIII